MFELKSVVEGGHLAEVVEALAGRPLFEDAVLKNLIWQVAVGPGLFS